MFGLSTAFNPSTLGDQIINTSIDSKKKEIENLTRDEKSELAIYVREKLRADKNVDNRWLNLSTAIMNIPTIKKGGRKSRRAKSRRAKSRRRR